MGKTITPIKVYSMNIGSRHNSYKLNIFILRAIAGLFLTTYIFNHNFECDMVSKVPEMTNIFCSYENI